MFYSHQSDIETTGSMLAGEGFTCYRSTRIMGGLPKFLMDMPTFNDKGIKTGSFPILDSDYRKLLEFQDIKPSVFSIIPTWILKPEFPKNGDKDWTCKKIASIWEGTWQRDAEEWGCTRIKCADGSDIYLLSSQPKESDEVTWVQIL